MVISIADIQKDLPDWDDDVVEQWLHYFANEPDCGWPPPEPLGDHRWGRLLGSRPLTWWKQVIWQQEEQHCGLPQLSAKARADVTEIVQQMNLRTADMSTQRRVAQPFLYLRDKGVFPRAPLMIKKPDGLSIIDGAHRMAAFELIQSMPDAELQKLKIKKPSRDQNVWVGRHISGELPFG
ncbi:hypothetical protein [Tardiphaga sp. 803_E3_N1_3]|uniref:hypothetical protein n=1 Tax=unclassified Tardiphaga TaxID=2631404 RepID=UPI0011C37A40